MCRSGLGFISEMFPNFEKKLSVPSSSQRDSTGKQGGLAESQILFPPVKAMIFLTFVPALNIAPRAPFGPSLVLNAGMPFDGNDVDLQKSAALRSETLRG
jgi:hypothetical protein